MCVMCSKTFSGNIVTHRYDAQCRMRRSWQKVEGRPGTVLLVFAMVSEKVCMRKITCALLFPERGKVVGKARADAVAQAGICDVICSCGSAVTRAVQRESRR